MRDPTKPAARAVYISAGGLWGWRWTGAVGPGEAQVADDRDAFVEALRSQLPALRRFAATLVAVDDADDCVQAALSRAWLKRHQQDQSRGTTGAWLFAIVRDQARQQYRQRRRAWTVDEVEQQLRGPDGTSVDVRRAVNDLPVRQRIAIVLFHYVDLPVADIAAVMDCSVGTVKSTLHDARRALELRLGASYGQD